MYPIQPKISMGRSCSKYVKIQSMKDVAVIEILMIKQNRQGKSKVIRIKVIKGGKMMLISLYYSTRDSDLLVSLSICPDTINSLSRETSLSAESITKFVIKSQHFLRSRFRVGRIIVRRFGGIAICSMFIDRYAPGIVITWFVISIHVIMFKAATIMIASAPKIFPAIHGDGVLLLN